MLFFKSKKPILNETRSDTQDNVDLQIINKMNQEFAISLDLSETLKTALQIIIARLEAQAANVFLINNKPVKFTCRLMGIDTPEMKPPKNQEKMQISQMHKIHP